MSELLYLQSFTYYMSNQYTHTAISTSQMSQQIIECILILFRFYLRILHTIEEYSCLKWTFTDCVANQNINFDMLEKELWCSHKWHQYFVYTIFDPLTQNWIHISKKIGRVSFCSIIRYLIIFVCKKNQFCITYFIFTGYDL